VVRQNWLLLEFSGARETGHMAAMNAAAARQGRARAGVSVNARLYEVHCSRRWPRSGLVGRLAGGEATRSLDVVCAAAAVAICRRLVPRVDRSALSALSLSLSQAASYA